MEKLTEINSFRVMTIHAKMAMPGLQPDQVGITHFSPFSKSKLNLYEA